MLPEYHRFMSERCNGRNSLLTRICGMYSVTFLSGERGEGGDGGGGRAAVEDRWDGGYFPSTDRGGGGEAAARFDDDERIYLVMHSVFPPDASSFVTERYDLKGSTAGRECSPEERLRKGSSAVLKDLDLMRDAAEERRRTTKEGAKEGGGYGICLGPRKRAALLAQLGRDVDLLRRCDVLDYSLLVGVADAEGQPRRRSGAESSPRAPKTPFRSLLRWTDFPLPYHGARLTVVDGGPLSVIDGTRRGRRATYYLGIIDFLQPWTVAKRLERDLKGWTPGTDGSAVSCAAPGDYAERFLRFVEAHVT
ncbi:hypothetical protein ACHAWF_002354 [Thalassiosira exigua]